jgi:hypothetical protein
MGGQEVGAPPKGKVYLAISPGRGELKVADKAGPLPMELKGKSYDDPLVMKAYLAYCRRAVEFFKPDYLAIGIEVNEIHNLGSKPWDLIQPLDVVRKALDFDAREKLRCVGYRLA